MLIGLQRLLQQWGELAVSSKHPDGVVYVRLMSLYSKWQTRPLQMCLLCICQSSLGYCIWNSWALTSIWRLALLVCSLPLMYCMWCECSPYHVSAMCVCLRVRIRKNPVEWKRQACMLNMLSMRMCVFMPLSHTDWRHIKFLSVAANIRGAGNWRVAFVLACVCVC